MGEVSDTKTLQEVRRPNGISTETCQVQLRKTSGNVLYIKDEMFPLISGAWLVLAESWVFLLFQHTGRSFVSLQCWSHRVSCR